MFAGILADYYGSPTPLQQLAGFQVPEPRTVLISPYDKSSMTAIEKAIRDSDLGVNPGNDGAVIRVVMPQLTEERRKDLVKVVRQRAEDGKVAVRNVRRDTMKHLEELVRNGEVGDDEERRAEAQAQAATRRFRSHWFSPAHHDVHSQHPDRVAELFATAARDGFFG